MSSIMDALRRLERERQDQHAPPPFDLPAETARRPRRLSRSLLRAAAAGAILAGTAVGALWMIRAGGTAWRDEPSAVVPDSRNAEVEAAGEGQGVRIAALPAAEEGRTAPLPPAAEPALSAIGRAAVDASAKAADAGPVPTQEGPAAHEGNQVPVVVPKAPPAAAAAPPSGEEPAPPTAAPGSSEAAPMPLTAGVAPAAAGGSPSVLPPLEQAVPAADTAVARTETAPADPTVAGIAGDQTGGNAVWDAHDQEGLDRLQEQLRERRHAVMARRAAAAAAEKAVEAPRPWQRPLAAPAPPPSPAAEIAALPAPEEPLAAGDVVPPEGVAGERTDLAARRPDDTLPSLPETDAPPAIESGTPAADGVDLPGGAAPRPEAVQPGESVAHRPPRGAPRVHVSFLFYSEDPGRRRVMLTVNQSPDLITLYEGQTHEAFEVARILPAEVHLRYQGQLFAVGAGH